MSCKTINGCLLRSKQGKRRRNGLKRTRFSMVGDKVMELVGVTRELGYGERDEVNGGEDELERNGGEGLTTSEKGLLC